MRTFPAAKILIIILFVGSTQCTEEERVTSFEDRLASIKEMSKAASLALQESFSVVKIDKGYKIVFDQEAALARAKSSLKSAGFAEVNLPQIQPIDLSKALSKNSYGYVTKIEDRLMNTPSLKSVFPSAGRVKVTPQEVGQYFQSVAYEVETQALADPNLTENERLEIILCTSLVYEITPWFVTNYSSYFENGIPVDERTKGWVKNLFKTVFNSVFTLVGYVVNYTLYGVVVGVMIGAVEGAIIGGTIGAIFGFGAGTACIISAYTGGSGNCYRCTFCVEDWVNDPCYQPTCPW